MTVCVQVPVTDLVRTLNNALLGMISTDKVANEVRLPALECAYIRWQAGVLFVSATDRYVVIWESLPAVETGDAGELLLHYRDIKSLVKMFKDVPTPLLATIHLEEDKVTVSVDGFASLTARSHEDELSSFPKLETLLFEWKDEPRDFGQIALNPDILFRLVKLKSEYNGVPLRFQLGETPTKPVAFKLGENLKGLAMPVRITA